MSDPITTARRNTRARAGLSELPFVTPEDIGERAMEAIRGGRQITAHLNSLQDYQREALAGRGGQEAVNRVWHGSIDPAIGWASWARSGDSWRPGMDIRSDRRLTVEQAEAMVGWPIYRAAMLAPIDDVLYPEGDINHEWDSETIEHVADAAREVRAGTAPVAREGIRPATTCGMCDHPGTVDDHDIDGCVECDELAQTGQYAPCQTA